MENFLSRYVDGKHNSHPASETCRSQVNVHLETFSIEKKTLSRCIVKNKRNQFCDLCICVTNVMINVKTNESCNLHLIENWTQHCSIQSSFVSTRISAIVFADFTTQSRTHTSALCRLYNTKSNTHVSIVPTLQHEVKHIHQHCAHFNISSISETKMWLRQINNRTGVKRQSFK